MLCMNCGYPLPEDDAVCPQCGFVHGEEEIENTGMQTLQMERGSDRDALVEALLQAQEENMEIAPEELDLENILAANYDMEEGLEDLTEEEIYPAWQKPQIPADAEPAAPETKKSSKKLWIILGAAALTLILAVGAVLCVWGYLSGQRYDQAMALLQEEKHDQAWEIFKSLGNFRDSAEKVRILEQMNMAYETAVAGMLEGKFDGVEDVFTQLGSYRDSQQMLQFGISWYKAEYLFNCAKNRDMSGAELLSGVNESTEAYLVWVLMLMTAKEQYSQIPEYGDATEKIQLCYLEAAGILVEEGQIDTAMVYKDWMDEATQEIFMEQVREASADEVFLESLKTSLKARLDIEKKAYEDLRPSIQIEQAYLGVYQNSYFLDKRLEKIAKDYLEGVYLQWMALDDQGCRTDIAGWARGEYLRTKAVDDLFMEYGFLADDETLRQYYVGRSEWENTYYRIHNCLQSQLADSMSGLTDAPGKTQFFNDSGFAFNVTFVYTFYLDGEQVDQSTLTMAVNAEQVKTLQGRNSQQDYDRWTMTWEAFDITGNGQVDVTGKYTIYSMHMLQYGSLFTQEDLAAAGRGGDAVEFYEDGTGIYTSQGTTVDICYDGEGFWFTDNPGKKIPFVVSGGELTFAQEETEYIYRK